MLALTVLIIGLNAGDCEALALRDELLRRYDHIEILDADQYEAEHWKLPFDHGFDPAEIVRSCADLRDDKPGYERISVPELLSLRTVCEPYVLHGWGPNHLTQIFRICL